MILQNIVFPDQAEMPSELYYRSDVACEYKENQGIFMNCGGSVDFTTYFNGFSVGKWAKYTQVQTLNFTLTYEGELGISVCHKRYDEGKIFSKTIYQGHVDSNTKKTETFDLGVMPSDGVIGVQLVSKKAGTQIYGGAYGTDDDLQVRDIQIGIGICTFKREAYVQKNMEHLKKSILDRPEALSHGHYTVCISDNGQTLEGEMFEHPQILLVKNKNLGGVGGFTRTMLEHMKNDRPLTHILLMDDDAMFSSASLERQYVFLTLLKSEYKDYVMGGSLIRLDDPTLQYESGARWNKGDIEALKMDYDLSNLTDVLRNEIEEKIEYVGWWYACIPLTQIKEKKLPLPLFIHRDDIEFGLRAKGFIMLNGICAWHEAFQNKMPGSVEYYDIRNLGIINAIHYENFSKKDFKKQLFIAVSSNIGKYRYKYAYLNLKGAMDFLKGFEWFYETDTLELHKSLGKYNYVSRPLEKFKGYHGLTEKDLKMYRTSEKVPSLMVKLFRIASLNGTFFPAKTSVPKVVIPWPNIYELYRCKEVIYVDNLGQGVGVKRSRKNLIRTYVQMFKVFRKIDQHFDRVCQEYRENYERLIDMDFWNKYLEL